MLTSLIAGFIGCMIGVSLWTFPDMYKALKRRKSMKKIAKQKLFEEEIKGIVLNEIKRLYNNGEQQQRESNIVEKE
jgi:hypothetical protein